MLTISLIFAAQSQHVSSHHVQIWSFLHPCRWLQWGTDSSYLFIVNCKKSSLLPTMLNISCTSQSKQMPKVKKTIKWEANRWQTKKTCTQNLQIRHVTPVTAEYPCGAPWSYRPGYLPVQGCTTIFIHKVTSLLRVRRSRQWVTQNLMRALIRALLIEIKNKTNALNVQHPHRLQSHRKWATTV